MSTVKIGIVEDEMIIALGIANTLTELGYAITEPAASYTEALQMIATEKPDLLLLDIQLGGYKDGIDLAETVRREHNLPFIFLTANADAATVERAKRVSPNAYLVKPFRKEDLYTAIELCLHSFADKKEETAGESAGYVLADALFIKQGQLFHKVKLADILYLESDNVYVSVHTAGGKFLVRSTLPKYLDTIGSARFVRVHRSYAVNVDHIQSVSTQCVVIGKAEIPVAKTYADALLSHLRLG